MEPMEYEPVQTKQELLDLISALVEEGGSTGWQNETAHSFLTALASWLEDADGFYKNMGIACNTQEASWQLFADALQAATVYE